MNLRTRFTILIGGSILIPMLVMMIAFWFFNNYMSVTDPVWAAKNFHDRMAEMDSEEDYSELSSMVEEPYFVMMVEEPDVISSSDATIFDYDKNRVGEDFYPRMIINSKTRELSDGRNVFILFGMNLFKVNGKIFPSIFMFSMCFALILLSLLTIRSINRSIAKLESATVKIAEGDLNVTIDTSGNDKFGSLARSLDSMRQQVKSEYDRRNRFFMGVSHDLKTPLASITGYADALIEGMAEDKESTEKYLKIIKDKSHQLEDRITHLIHYLKLSNYDFQTSLSESSIKQFLSEFGEIHKEEAAIYNRNFQLSIDVEDKVIVNFDKDLLGRALENLIQNAYRYGEQNSEVRLSCAQGNEQIKILVENSGNPIPEDQLELIFEPFYRADQSRKGEGFGLGLASVKSIIESHGWKIEAKSDSNKTSFVITASYLSD